ncbi:novel containing four WD domain, G-beta repeats [Pelobates cultripes]|uniref:Novel containing four WD domain, G-beta repeats n=1 Tax=Pelobates cultripes TaxID=61616 RepID=A0AAD1TET1_PELCU|nr:novel containing four WD domain, G-beta repeats [Pelobates cultripes]
MDTTELRKLRKKLRQIEVLEHLPRELNASEMAKVSQKLELRCLVEQILSHSIGVNPVVEHAQQNEDHRQPDSPPQHVTSKQTQKSPESFPLQNSKYLVHRLKGHDDLVTCVIVHGPCIISGSWDTTVRVWDIRSCSEQKTLCGHTGAVNCLAFLPLKEDTLDPDIWPPNEEFVSSGSSDCSIRVWSMTTGRPVFSIYTFSEVSSLVYSPKTPFLISGSDGGKIDVWDLQTKQNVHSERAHGDRVTSLQFHSGLLFSGSSDGSLKVWKLSSSGTLSLVHSCDELMSSLHGLHSICITGEKAYIASQGVCVKAVTWKQDRLIRLSNHTSGTGFVDAVAVTSDDLLVASGFNVDQGQGYLNVRNAKTGNYLGTLSHRDAPRLLCLAVSRGSAGLCCWVTGGRELLLWEEQPKKRLLDGDTIQFQFCSGFLNSAPDSESDDEEEFDLWEADVKSAPFQSESQGWQWCVLV